MSPISRRYRFVPNLPPLCHKVRHWPAKLASTVFNPMQICLFCRARWLEHPVEPDSLICPICRRPRPATNGSSHEKRDSP